MRGKGRREGGKKVKEYKEATRILNQAEMQVGAKVVSKRGIFQNFLCSAVFLPYLYYTALQNIEGFISTRAAAGTGTLAASSAPSASLAPSYRTLRAFAGNSWWCVHLRRHGPGTSPDTPRQWHWTAKVCSNGLLGLAGARHQAST